MPGKTVPVSVRLTPEDIRFLDQLNIGGAETHSEKLRAVISQARQRQAGQHSYAAGLSLVQELLNPVRLRIWNNERLEHSHSELLSRLYEWLPDTMALALAGTDHELDAEPTMSLKEFESLMATRMFRLVEMVLRLAMTRKAPCYDPDVVRSKLAPTMELAELLAKIEKVSQ